MSDTSSNLATMREIYYAYDRGNNSPLMNALADDFAMHEHAPDSTPWGGVWKGPDGMEHFIACVVANMTHQEYICEDMIGRDDIVVSWGRFKTICKKSDEIVEGPWMHRTLFRDGKIVELHEFADSLSIAESFELASLN